MKTIFEMLADDKPSNVEKITKACEETGCSMFMTQFMEEAKKSSATDFPKMKVLVTDSFICDYRYLTGIGKKYLNLIPIGEVENAYRTNITVDNKYDHDGFYLAVEKKSGHIVKLAQTARSSSTYKTLYADIIQCIKNKMMVLGE